MTRPRAFCELPAGLAAVSLRLHGGPHCRPPISRMGSKAGYAEVVLAALGLRSGGGAGAYVWAEADADVRALLRAYPDADMLRRIADIIRGWKDEEPRALWERLRAERKARGPAVDDTPASWIVSEAWGSTGQWCGPDRGGPCGSHPPGWVGSITLDGLTDRCTRLAEFAAPSGDAGALERVAGFLVCTTHFRGSLADLGGFNDQHVGTPGSQRPYDISVTARQVGHIASRWPPVAVLAALPDAAGLSALLGTPGDLDGVVVYMDPPYQGTTGYLADLPRAEVVRLALDYHRAGAVVCVSEAVEVAELVAAGWWGADITAGRRGQRRTFARVASEALTMNREPAHRVAVQHALFGGAA